MPACSRFGLVAFAGLGEKYFSNLPGTPSNSLASAGGSRLAVMFGHFDAYSALTSQPLLEAGLGVRLDRVDRAFRLADPAVDALVGVDDEHVLALVEAVDRADLDAIHVFAADAVVVDDVGHADPYRNRSWRECRFDTRFAPGAQENATLQALQLRTKPVVREQRRGKLPP